MENDEQFSFLCVAQFDLDDAKILFYLSCVVLEGGTWNKWMDCWDSEEERREEESKQQIDDDGIKKYALLHQVPTVSHFILYT